MTDYLARTTLLRLLAVLALVIAPHLLRLPPWASLLILTAILWRGLVAARQWRLPPPWLRALAALAAFVGVYASFRSVSGLTAGTALLSVMAALKLLEMRARRDVMVVVLLMYFILVTHFLFAQEMWTILYLLGSAVAITALLMDCNHPGEPLPVRELLRMAGVMVAQALPLMLAFFILFPRIPGPLWGLPADTGAKRTGLTNRMMPGDIARLIESDEVAFRVRFLGPPPPANQRYWRGPVFDFFDGRGWQAGGRPEEMAPPRAELAGPAYTYELILEPHAQQWLFALDLPSPADLPPATMLRGAYQLLSTTPINDRRLYTLTSYPRYRLEPRLPAWQRNAMLQLPPYSNARSRALAQRWRDQGLDDAAIVERALRMYHEESFYYTLRPPLLGRDNIDGFLFDSRKGFCEHYAGSFTFLMRAAGIPARVVAGYLGGEKNEVGDYYLLHQYDAHAWSEVWLAGRGWVRVDPTGMVAPQRMEQGLASAVSAAEGLPRFLSHRASVWSQLGARWDWANNQWNRWVLAYGPELQAEFLQNFGIRDWSQMILWLTVTVTVMLGAVGLVLLRQYAPARSEDPALRLWRRATRALAARGLQQRPDEGPRDFMLRVAAEQPSLATAARRVLDGYLRLRYLDQPAPELERELALAIRELKRRR